MLSFACVLDSVGYDRLMRDKLAEPTVSRRCVLGTAATFCDLVDCDDDDDDDDDDEVRMRSPDGRSRGGSPPGSTSLKVEARVMRTHHRACGTCSAFHFLFCFRFRFP
jgi:hypothetical protein